MAILAVPALIAAVLAPPASAQSRSIGTVVIANGWSSADSAVASALAALESDSRSDAVVLYASRRQLTTRTANFIEDNQPSDAILIGGTAALSTSVEADVVDLLGSAAVRRIEGTDRFDTAAKAVPSSATTFIVANGFSPADTGVAAALAATRTDAAVLLATTDSLTAPTERVIREQQPLAVEFVGGTAVLAAELVDRVRELAPSVRSVPRHSGTSRTATAAAAAPNRSTTLVIANGWSPADMGVAAAYAAITSGAAVLYSDTRSLTSPTESRIRALTPREIVLVGGSAALDTRLHARLHELAPEARIRRISGSDRIDTAVRAADGALTTVATELPGAPTSLTTVSRNLSLSVSWRAPAPTSSDVDDAITGYVVEYRACTATPRTCATSPRWTGWITRSHSGTGTSTTITNLTNSTAYEVRVRARNSFGLGPWSATESGIPLAQTAKPSVPSGLTVEAANRLLQVSWADSTPPRDGTVDGYDVEYRACTASDTTCATSPSWGNWRPHSHLGTSTTTTITRLNNGTTYQVRVQATSSKGDSGWSPTRSATPALLSSFERAPTLTASDRQIVVQWNEPADSGSAIRDYDVQYRPCTATDSDTTDLTCDPDAVATWGGWRSRSHSGTGQVATITGLTNGTAYEVQVRASNATGVGPWSTAAKATPVSVPAKPNTPTLEPGNQKLVVTWTAPSDNGRGITGYDVEYCTGTCASDSDDWEDASASGTDTRHEITPLDNGTAYKVRVRATNNLGDGPWSSIRSATPRALPEAPIAPTLTAGDRQIEVVWVEPTTNGTTINGYDIQYRACTATPKDCSSNPRWGSWRTKGHTDTGTLESTITSLTNGTEYEVRVRARISGGVGPYSQASAEIPLGKPAKPATPKLTAGDGTLMVTWTPPADNGSPITDYDVERCESTTDCTDDANWVEDSPAMLPTPDKTTGTVTHTLDGLTNGTTYRVRVRAINDVGGSGQGLGPWSSTVSGTPTVRPDAPTNLNVTVANRQLGLSWSAPSGRGVTISGYHVEYRACEATGSDETDLTCDSDPTWGDWKTHAHSGVGISATIGRLTNGTKYEVRVRARNANGEGPWSAEPYASGTPVAAPSPPTDLTVEAANQQLRVSWTESATNGATITGYVMEHRECLATPKSCTSNPRWSDWTRITVAQDQTTEDIDGRTNGTKYQVRVQATSNNGDSGWSQIKSGTPAAVPNAPGAPTLTADDRQIRVEWTAPEDHDSAIRDYDVEYRACTATDSDTTVRTCDTGTEATWGSWLPHGHSGASLSAIIMGLTNGTNYQVRVRATNANGVGPWLTDPPDATPVGAPAMPTTPRVTTGDTQLRVDWITPRSNGSDIDGYDVWHRTCISTNADAEVLTCATNPAWGTWTQLTVAEAPTTRTIAGLANGTAYQIQVRARAGSSEGPWSSPVTSIPTGRPDAPTVMLTSGNQRLIVSWPTPNARGSTITGFKLRYCDTADTAKDCNSDYDDWTTRTGIGARSTSYTITGLANGNSHYVEMLTTSRSHGDSVWTSRTFAMPGAPNAPSTPRLTAGNTEITVTWAAPAKNHSDIDRYEVAYCNDTDADDTFSCASGNWSTTQTTDLDNRSLTLPSLVNGKTYKVRVRAQNTQGWGAWSPTPSARPTT